MSFPRNDLTTKKKSSIICGITHLTVIVRYPRFSLGIDVGVLCRVCSPLTYPVRILGPFKTLRVEGMCVEYHRRRRFGMEAFTETRNFQIMGGDLFLSRV